MKKIILLISNFDEFYGPLYPCPFCAVEKVMDDFNFCPFCGKDLKAYGFEDEVGYSKRVKKKNEETGA